MIYDFSILSLCQNLLLSQMSEHQWPRIVIYKSLANIGNEKVLPILIDGLLSRDSSNPIRTTILSSLTASKFTPNCKDRVFSFNILIYILVFL